MSKVRHRTVKRNGGLYTVVVVGEAAKEKNSRLDSITTNLKQAAETDEQRESVDVDMRRALARHGVE